MDDSLQPTIDMLLNLSIFMWFGAVCPWSSFLQNDTIPIYRLIFLGILILLVRRMPVVFAMHKWIHQIEHLQQAAFVGFFGPIGVGAIFYLSVCREFLREITVDGEVREDAQTVMDAVNIVVWFLVICSIVSTPNIRPLPHPTASCLNTNQVVHGMSVPIGKAGYHLPRTISSAISTSTTNEPEPVPISNVRHTHSTAMPPDNTASSYRSRKRGPRESPRPPLFRIGRSVIRTRSPSEQIGVGQTDEPERPVNVVTHDHVVGAVDEQRQGSNSPV